MPMTSTPTQAADQHIRHPGLEARTGIPVGQPADAQREAVVKVRGYRARLMKRKMTKVITPATEVTRVAGAASAGRRPVPIRTGARNAPPPRP